jgi:hypothetical protein
MNSRISFLTFLAVSLFPGAVQAADIIYDDAENTDFYFISGEIEYGDGDNFKRIVENTHRNGRNTAVVLNSGGGNVLASFEMADLIDRNGFATVVLDNNHCYSACFAVFMAGAARLAYPQSNIGVHRVSFETGEDATTKGLSVDMNELYKDLNVPPAIRLAMLETPPSQMYILSPEEKKQISTVDVSDFSSPKPKPNYSAGLKEKHYSSLRECTAEFSKLLSSEDYPQVTEILLGSVIPEIARLTSHKYNAFQAEQLKTAVNAFFRQLDLTRSILSSAGITDEYSITRVSSALLRSLAMDLLMIEDSYASVMQQTLTENPPVYARFSDIHNLAFADRYNELRELCRAGFCNEETVKEQERAWIERNNALVQIYKNTQYETFVNEYMIDRQIEFINTVKYVISSRVKDRTYVGKFDFSSHRSLMTSVSELYGKITSLTVDEILQYNAVLGAYIIPFLEYELKEAGYDYREYTDLSLTGGAYDLVYREFFVSSNRMFYGKDYDKNATEFVKLEGKIMRVANMLLLLLKDADLSAATYYHCRNRYCTKDEAETAYHSFENFVKSLGTVCRKQKCNAKQLERMKGVYIQYDRLMGKITMKHKAPWIHHVMTMMRIWPAGRLIRDYNTYSGR